MQDMPVGPRRRASYDRDWTQGSMFKNLLLLSWPLMITNTLMMLGPTIDMVWVGKLGSASIAGVGVAGMAVQLVVVAMMSMMMGVRAMIARFIGAGDEKGASHIIAQAFIIALSFAVVMAVIGMLMAEDILLAFGLEPEVVTEGAAYLRVLFVGAIAMSFRIAAEAVMQASGDTVTPMKIAIGYRLLHIALCPFLIFGWWIFPRMGVTGAAVTNIVSQSLGGTIGLWVLLSGRSRLHLDMRQFKPDLRLSWRIARIGFPALITGIQRNFSQIMLMWLVVPFGTIAVAAHTINQRTEMMLFMPGMSFGIGAGTLIGQNLGADKPDQAEKSGWLAVAIVEVLMLLGSLLLLLGAEYVVRIFNSEPGLVTMASAFLRIAVAGYVVVGFMGVLQQAISGAGDTLPPMIISIVTVWLFTLPLAYFLPKITDLGVYGVRWGMAAGMIVPAISLAVYFKLGRWKTKKV